MSDRSRLNRHGQNARRMAPDCHDGRRRASHQSGVTLLEMLVVLVIIALIAGLVGVRLITQVDRSKSVAADAQIHLIKTAIETAQIDLGRLPSEQEGLAILYTPPPNAKNWFGPYLDAAAPADPWGRPYIYKPSEDGRRFYLYSLGEDGAPGGQGAAQDIGILPPDLQQQQG